MGYSNIIHKNKNKEFDKNLSNKYTSYTIDEEEELIYLYKQGLLGEEIAIEMKRSIRGIAAKLKRMGIIEKRSDIYKLGEKE